MRALLIETNDLRKTYGKKVTALAGINLSVDTGMFGLLGPNGAGKTTLMRILATILAPTSGEVEILGLPMTKTKEIRAQLGYLPQTFGFYPTVSVYDTLRYFASMGGYHLSRAKTLSALEQVGLAEVAYRRAGSLSGGMRQRLGLCIALVGSPRLLIVDEPTAGLDPGMRVEYRNLLASMSSERLVVLSTHIVADVETCCSSLAVMNKGKIVYQGRPSDLAQLAQGHTFSATVPLDQVPSLGSRLTATAIINRGDKADIRILSPDIGNLTDSLSTAKEVAEPTVEEGYLWLTSTTDD